MKPPKRFVVPRPLWTPASHAKWCCRWTSTLSDDVSAVQATTSADDWLLLSFKIEKKKILHAFLDARKR